METKEKVFKGFTVNGFAMMFVAIALLAGSIWLFSQFDLLGNASVVLGIVGVFLFVLLIPGFFLWNRMKPVLWCFLENIKELLKIQVFSG